MNIALVLRSFSARGGTEGYAVNLSRWLAGRGHEVHVYAATVDPSVVTAGVRVHRVSAGSPRILGFARVTSRIRDAGHDVVQGFGRSVGHDVYRAGGGVHAAWLSVAGDSAYTRVRARLSPAEWVARYLDRRAVREARIVICNSRLVASQMVAYHGVEESRLRVIRNGVDGQRFRPRRALREQVRARLEVRGRLVAFVGNGFRRKGLRVAGRAFARLARPSDRFVVVGGDAHAERYLRPVRRLLGDQLIVRGSVADPERVMAAADATVLPTRYDAAANTTLEALACGVPPVTSARDGNAEIVPDRRLVVADPEDVGQVADALRFALSESNWVARCRSVAEGWTVERNGREVEQVYRECIDGR